MSKPKFLLRGSINRMFLLFSVVYSCILLLLGTVACYFSYGQRQESLLSNLSSALDHLEQQYLQTTDNFWQVYMPVFTDRDSSYLALGNFFSNEGYGQMTPIEKRDLVNTLQTMMVRDSNVQWIALFSDVHDKGYILNNGNSSGALQELGEDFPYWQRVRAKTSQMEIYSQEYLKEYSATVPTYAICGGVPQGMASGKILVGYSTAFLQQIADSLSPISPSANIGILAGEEILFSSGGLDGSDILDLPREAFSGVYSPLSGQRVYLRTVKGSSHNYLLYGTVPWDELYVYSHQNTPLIIAVVLFFLLLAIGFNFINVRTFASHTGRIQQGLKIISSNNLDYRFPSDGFPTEFRNISDAINTMTADLQTNINRAYYYELKQREAELSDLQSKFNPHFLYNSLEMIRARVYQNGDTDTAELITTLSSIFRGFISSKSFVPIGEELSSSQRYLALFRARYADKVHIHYDVDTEVLRYGIIRGVLQPLIENYFVHGFDPSEERNTLVFRGKCQPDGTILITIIDNGLGMPPEKIATLTESLNRPITMENESYGLKNIHQRLRLFYGGDCGLSVRLNGEKGLYIELRILQQTCEEQALRESKDNPQLGEGRQEK